MHRSVCLGRGDLAGAIEDLSVARGVLEEGGAILFEASTPHIYREFPDEVAIACLAMTYFEALRPTAPAVVLNLDGVPETVTSAGGYALWHRLARSGAVGLHEITIFIRIKRTSPGSALHFCRRLGKRDAGARASRAEIGYSMSRNPLPKPGESHLRGAPWRLLSGLAASLLALGTAAHADSITLRVGHFPNITHVQALVAHGLTRQGKGWFEARLGPDVKIDWYVYNAGPSAMEAIFAASIDLTYVGPGPAINAYSKSRGQEIRIVAGAVDGGSALVVQPDSTLATPEDFRGKVIATPQFGNTQDVAARAWLTAGGLKITPMGGDAKIVPTENPDQLPLFQRKAVDGVWTVEPWVSRLELEAHGKILVDERDSVTTVLVSSMQFLDVHRDLARKFVEANAALTAWIADHPDEAKEAVRAEIAAETRAAIGPDLIAHAWPRIVPVSEIPRDGVEAFVAKSKEAGFLKTLPAISGIFVQP
jgi:NitT/TauT family transport system substrate-binding protein